MDADDPRVPAPPPRVGLRATFRSRWASTSGAGRSSRSCPGRRRPTRCPTSRGRTRRSAPSPGRCARSTTRASGSSRRRAAAGSGLPTSRREVICHNDFAPYNLMFEDGRLTGVIDLDLASPGPRVWDMAYTAYRFVPLTDPANPDAPFPGADGAGAATGRILCRLRRPGHRGARRPGVRIREAARARRVHRARGRGRRRCPASGTGPRRRPHLPARHRVHRASRDVGETVCEPHTVRPQTLPLSDMAHGGTRH